MRLINTHTLELEEHAFESVKRRYAILSHTWGDDEITFEDMQSPDERTRMEKSGWWKILYTCSEAGKSGLDYAWIDTCCINKSSSSELSESINSMWRLYEMSNICYVYMSDVGCQLSSVPINALLADEEAPSTRLSGSTLTEFRASRWFRRGWTLQELIAPKRLRFYGRDWVLLGQTVPPRHWERASDVATVERWSRILEILSAITMVPISVLAGLESIRKYSVAQRMSWASQRLTTRVEDQAYCLLGLFDINMPLLYGEGTKAFRRLQEEIVKAQFDQSLFAWEAYGPDGRPLPRDLAQSRALFAASPAQFSDCADVVTWTPEGGTPSYHLTNKGLEISFCHPRRHFDVPSIPHLPAMGRTVAILQCRRADDFSHALAIHLSEPSADGQQLVQAKINANHLCRRTQVSLRAKDIIGPVRTTIVSDAVPPLLGLPPADSPRRLLIESLLPKPFEIHKLEPAAQWNRKTLVMTPSQYLPIAHNVKAFSPNGNHATICFEYDARCYLIRLLYRADVFHSSVAITRIHFPTSQEHAGATEFGIPFQSAPVACDDENNLCCQLIATTRLGQSVTILCIGLTDGWTSDVIAQRQLEFVQNSCY